MLLVAALFLSPDILVEVQQSHLKVDYFYKKCKTHFSFDVLILFTIKISFLDSCDTLL